MLASVLDRFLPGFVAVFGLDDDPVEGIELVSVERVPFVPEVQHDHPLVGRWLGNVVRKLLSGGRATVLVEDVDRIGAVDDDPQLTGRECCVGAVRVVLPVEEVIERVGAYRVLEWRQLDRVLVERVRRRGDNPLREFLTIASRAPEYRSVREKPNPPVPGR